MIVNKAALKFNMAEEIEPNEKEKELETKINREIEKLNIQTNRRSRTTDDLLDEKDYKEIETVSKRSEVILNEIYSLVSSMQEVKVDRGEYTARAIRQWKKNAKETYVPWVSRLDKLQAVLAKRKDDINREERDKKREAIRQEEEQYREEVRQRERQLLQDRLQSELEITEKKLEMEKAARATQAKLPKLTITAFKGTASDWVRFENMFLTQVDCKPITDEEKFGYLLEMVSGKVRDKKRPGND